MRILLLTYYFPPEIGSGPHLPYELGESLVRAGHEVTVVTSFPRYHVDTMPAKYRGKLFCREEMGGMTVLRINAPNAYTGTKTLRGVVQEVVPWLLAIRCLGLKAPDIVFTQTPPLPMGLAACAVARWFKVPAVVNVQDLFPQSAVDLGMLRSRTLIRFFEWMERRIYRKAAAITVMSEGNRQFVIDRGAGSAKVHTVFNWVDTELITPCERLNAFRTAHGLGDKFVVLFAGTMGWSQGLTTVVEAARQLVCEPAVVFAFVGDGVEKERLERQATGLPNVRFIPMQPKEVYPQVLAAADACLVTLVPEVATPTVPSKIGTIMAAGRPILASLPPGDAPRLIAEADAGLIVPPGDAAALAAAVLTLKENPAAAQRMAEHGRLFAEKCLSRRICTQRNEELFASLVARKPPPKQADDGPAIVPQVRRAEAKDLDAVVRVHLSSFRPGSTLAVLGPPVLRKYYQMILGDSQGIFFVAEAAGGVVGFAAGFIGFNRFYTGLRAKRHQFLLPLISTCLRNPRRIATVIAVWRRPLLRRWSEVMDESNAELASIAVSPAFQKHGCGAGLVRAFIEVVRSSETKLILLTTDAVDNDAVNAFYDHLGFQFLHTIQAPGQRLMNVYGFSTAEVPSPSRGESG